MSGRHHKGVIVLLIGLGVLGGLSVDQWARRTGGRSAAALAIADNCVNWEHQNASGRPKAGDEGSATCDRYFQFRSESEAESDELRWRQRKQR